jgi:carboxylesterase type B
MISTSAVSSRRRPFLRVHCNPIVDVVNGAPQHMWHRCHRESHGSDPVKVGAFHCSELVYVFGTQDTVDRPWEETDRQLSDVMSSYWVRFAETGNPNGPDLPEWLAFDEQSRHVKEFGTRLSVGPGPKAAPLIEATLLARLQPVKQ